MKYYLQFNIVQTNTKTKQKTIRMTYQSNKKTSYVIDLHAAMAILDMYKVPYKRWKADDITQHIEVSELNFFKLRRFLVAMRGL